jgi:hypothetical protein
MNHLPEGFEHAGLYCYRKSDEARTFFYLPGAPRPQRSAENVPMISLLASSTFAFLQLSTRWEAASQQLEALALEIARRERGLKASDVHLALAPVSVGPVTLELIDGAGHPTVLQTATSSGTPPFTALFNVQLTHEQRASVESALNGREEVLKVRYTIELAVSVDAKATLAGDVTRDLARLNHRTTLAEAAAQLDDAIRTGRVKLSQSGASDVTEAQWQKLKAQARQQAADLLWRMAIGTVRSPDAAHFSVDVSETVAKHLTLERTTDIARWFTQPGGLEHMKLIGT